MLSLPYLGFRMKGRFFYLPLYLGLIYVYLLLYLKINQLYYKRITITLNGANVDVNIIIIIIIIILVSVDITIVICLQKYGNDGQYKIRKTQHYGHLWKP